MHNINLANFWEDSDFARKEYVGAPITHEMIQSVQDELGYRLPNAYIELLRSQNGGIPIKKDYRTSQPTWWAENHVSIAGIFGIDRNRQSSLCGEFGSKFWTKEWGYPELGVYFADCPSAGHDMLCLDYRECGKDGEPRVVHVAQESDYEITQVADNFAAFIQGLEDESAFESGPPSEPAA